jgi:hypothetical protein
LTSATKHRAAVVHDIFWLAVARDRLFERADHHLGSLGVVNAMPGDEPRTIVDQDQREQNVEARLMWRCAKSPLWRAPDSLDYGDTATMWRKRRSPVVAVGECAA